MPEWAGLQNLRKSRCSGTPPTSAAEAALSCCSYGSAEAEPFKTQLSRAFSENCSGVPYQPNKERLRRWALGRGGNSASFVGLRRETQRSILVPRNLM